MRRMLIALCGLLVVTPVLPSLTPSCEAASRKTRRVLKRPVQPYNQYYFPALKWRATLGMLGNTTPAIADLDLDGAMDIVFQAANNDQLIRLSDNGRVIWKVDLPEFDSVPDFGVANSGITLGDVNRDGTLDILLSQNKTLLCFNPDGRELWRRELGDAICSQPTVADLEGDGKPEILVGANDNKLHVLDSRGKDKWSFTTKSWIVGGAAVGNLDGDGQLEVVFGSMDYKIYCLNSKGRKKWEFATGEWVQAAPVIADVDGDNKPEVLGASDDGNLYCLSNLGTLKWQSKLAEETTRLRTYLAVGDLDRDGTLETIVALPSGQIAATNAYGDRVWTANAPGVVAGSPLIVDLNSDGWQEILCATQNGQLAAFNTWGSQQWTIALGQTVEATPAIADLNSNGKYEIYTANLMEANRDSGFFTKFELSVLGGPGQWVTMKGDPYRTGVWTNARDYGAAVKRGGDYATAWEPFGAGVRPKTQLQAPRRLRVTTLPLDDVKGNRDGALDPGETAVLKVRVSNVGSGPSYDNLLRLDLGDSPLTLNRNSLYLGWIAPGASKTATFHLSAPPLMVLLEKMRQSTFRDVAAPPDEDTPKSLSSTPLIQAAKALPVTARRLKKLKFETIDLKVFESGVLAALSESKVFNVPPLPPELTITQRQLLDGQSKLTAGNGNSRLDAGETAVLRLLLTNTNLTTAKSATVRLTSDTNEVLITTPLASLKDIVPYGGRWVSFGLRVARATKAPRVSLQLTTQTVADKLGPAPPKTETLIFPLRKTALDTVPPEIKVTSPATRLASVRGASATITGSISDASGITTFSFNQQSVPLTKLPKLGARGYRFNFVRPLVIGENVFPISVTDGAGNTATTWVRIVRKP